MKQFVKTSKCTYIIQSSKPAVLLDMDVILWLFSWLEILVTLHLIKKNPFGSKLKFYCNLLEKACPKQFLSFCKEIFIKWKANLYASPKNPLFTLYHFLWFRKYILIERNPLY